MGVVLTIELAQDFSFPYRYKKSFKQVICKMNLRDVKFPTSSRYSLINFAYAKSLHLAISLWSAYQYLAFQEILGNLL